MGIGEQYQDLLNDLIDLISELTKIEKLPEIIKDIKVIHLDDYRHFVQAILERTL